MLSKKSRRRRVDRVLVGYARTSTVDQDAGFEAQRRDLQTAGCKKIFAEQTSSVAEREQLDAAINYLRKGDVLVATKLDRLARSMRHLLQIVDQVKEKKASLRILAMGLDTHTATGTMILKVLGAAAEHERSMMLERQRIGIAKAKAEGKYRGRARTAMAKAGEVETLLAKGINPTEVARKLGIGRSSVYRAIKERKIKRRPVAYRPASRPPKAG
jgi:DNA invertase Pin-like site-specific DNA recombinase